MVFLNWEVGSGSTRVVSSQEKGRSLDVGGKPECGDENFMDCAALSVQRGGDLGDSHGSPGQFILRY